MKRAGSLIGVLLMAVMTSCAVISGHVPSPVPMPASGTLQAGAAKADLTPIPGFPMGGHSIGGSVARGYWLRLFARAIYLEDAAGQSIVLVSCDLWSLPAGLRDRVAELVRAEQPHVGREQIILAATHTHHSPGNFSSTRLYNDFAQRWSGFDRRLFDFLAHRIALAIRQAITSRRAATVTWTQTTVPGLARNRSIEAFVLNPESHMILQQQAALSAASQAYGAIDSRLALLKVQTVDEPSELIALSAFVALHPTAMHPATELYHSDLFGVASITAERELRRTPSSPEPIVAIFNGAQGDISPDWKRQDRRNTLRLGKLLAQKIINPNTTFEPIQIALEHHDRMLSLADNCFTDRSNIGQPAAMEHCTAKKPLPGFAMLGGAEDGRTIFHELGWQEGVKARGRLQPDHPNQGAKQPALDPPFITSRQPFSITRLVSSTNSIPQKVPLGVHRLAKRIVIATLPGEFSMVMGRRIERAIQQAVKPTPARVMVIGLANEYVSYFTTPEEYEAQHYEGASTLYGPYSGPLIKHSLQQLATAPPVTAKGHRFRYRPGPLRFFGPKDSGLPRDAPDAGLGHVAQDLHTALPVRDFPRFCWPDRIPEFPESSEDLAVAGVTPYVSIEDVQRQDTRAPLTTDGIKETDAGLDFITLVTAVTDTGSSWCAIWMPDPETTDVARTYRFRVSTLRKQTLCSQPFQLQEGFRRRGGALPYGGEPCRD